MNYTPEQTEYMVAKYLENPNRETVELLAEKMEKSIKSVIGKLSREGVYRREVYRTKTGEKPITKIEIVEHIAECLNLDSDKLRGLDKTPKAALKILWATLDADNELNDSTTI